MGSAPTVTSRPLAHPTTAPTPTAARAGSSTPPVLLATAPKMRLQAASSETGGHVDFAGQDYHVAGERHDADYSDLGHDADEVVDRQEGGRCGGQNR